MKLPTIGTYPARYSNHWKPAVFLLLFACASQAEEAATPVPLIASNITVLVEQGHGELDAAGSYTLRVYRRTPGTLDPLEFVAGELRPRDGTIERTWLRDFDGDGTWEILVWVVGAKEPHYGTLTMFRLAGNRLKEFKFPGLSDREDQGYAGRDVFRVVDNFVEREFPLYRETPDGAQPTGQRRLLRYAVEEGRWRKKGEETKGDDAGR